MADLDLEELEEQADLALEAMGDPIVVELMLLHTDQAAVVAAQVMDKAVEEMVLAVF